MIIFTLLDRFSVKRTRVADLRLTDCVRNGCSSLFGFLSFTALDNPKQKFSSAREASRAAENASGSGMRFA
jgi:hypothetical protein